MYKQYYLYSLYDMLEMSINHFEQASSSLHGYLGQSATFISHYIQAQNTLVQRLRLACPWVNDRGENFKNNMIEKLWQLICLRYKDSITAKTSVLINNITTYDNINTNNYIKTFTPFIDKVLFLMFSTYEKYKIIIDAYESQKEHLLDKLETTGRNVIRYNDTPQNEGVFSGDNHTTNITEQENSSSTEVSTPIARIREIEANISETYREWVDVFSECFIEDGNYLED